MQIVVIADIHGRVRRLQAAATDLTAADLVVLTGDITNFGRRAEAEAVIQAIETYNHRIVAVAGNCDYPEAEGYLAERGFDLHASHREIAGVTFVGLGGSLPAPVPSPNVYGEHELESFLAAAIEGVDPDAPLILVSHQPPKDTHLDRTTRGEHVGSVRVRRFIEERSPLLCLTGHIHEAAGMDQIGSTRLVNPGPLDAGRYAHIELDGEITALEIRGAGG
jgi:Icc-related predicted phosphoesterase